jgi:signal transduction histidine kinase/ActR/RegA family two-component response regulator
VCFHRGARDHGAQNPAQSVAQIGSWRIDLVRGEHSFSDEACKILGKPPGSTFSREEFISQIHAEDRAPVQRSIAASLEGEVFDIRYRILAAGRVKWVRSKAEVTFAPSGRPFEVIGTTQDVTNSVRVEKALEKAKNQAEQANHSKDLFLATLSHELRTPLNVIQLWAELMKAHKISASEMDIAIKAIDHNARTLGQIISDLLDVSRIISGKLILERENLDVNALLNEAVASARPLATLKSIEMDTDLDASLGMVLADRVRVIQIVSNLLSNATKFTPQNGRVVVRSRRAGEKCEIEVVDSGMGIAADFLPKIFDRFMQADSSRIRQQGGLGLGLAVVRDLAEMHGGSVSALSRGIGEGATFTVTLPLKQALGEPHSEAPISQPEALSTDLRGCRILFVDDSEDSREVISAALVALGAEVLTANSAQEGLRLLQEHRPDVLLSDISMPDEDGYALISKVRSIGSEVGATPAIALSANASGSDVLRSRQAGFRAHLSKPVDWNVLGHAIVKLVRDETQSES